MFEFCDYEPCSFCKKWIDDGSVFKKVFIYVMIV